MFLCLSCHQFASRPDVTDSQSVAHRLVTEENMTQHTTSTQTNKHLRKIWIAKHQRRNISRNAPVSSQTAWLTSQLCRHCQLLLYECDTGLIVTIVAVIKWFFHLAPFKTLCFIRDKNNEKRTRQKDIKGRKG